MIRKVYTYQCTHCGRTLGSNQDRIVVTLIEQGSRTTRRFCWPQDCGTSGVVRTILQRMRRMFPGHSHIA